MLSFISAATGGRATRFAALSLAVSGFAQAGTAAHAPVLSGAPPVSKVMIGNAYSFMPTATDADQDELTFTLKNAAPWMAFNTKVGAITGTPSEKGTWSNITFSVTDGTFTKTLPPFTVTVVGDSAPTPSTNSAPSIAGTPSINTVYGRPYVFTPAAFDVNNDTLTFSIQNKAVWMAFNTATGAITGTPWIKATWSNVIVSVSDGKSTTALPGFNVTVLPVALGNVTLSWTAPTLDVSGNTLTDLAGFAVVYGTAPDNMTQKLDVPDVSITSASIEELTSGTYYFAVKAYTRSGLVSDLSEIVYKQII